MAMIELEKIGIMGGGANAALLCLEAKKKGIQTTIVDEDMYCPAATIADEHLVGPLDESTLLKLIHRTDAIVFTRNLAHADDYQILFKEKIPVYPEVEVLEVVSSHQRFLWKMEQNDIPVMPYQRLNHILEVLEVLKDKELPISVTKYYKNPLSGKECEEIILLSENDIVDLAANIDLEEEIDHWLVEDIFSNAMDLSIGVTKDIKNKLHVYSVAQDIYEGGNWFQSYIPARTTKTIQNKAIALAKKVVKIFDGVGTFTVKLCITKDKELYVREVLPYALENAVYTNESCTISQYDHLLRVILGLPLFPAQFEGTMFVHAETGTVLAEFGNMNGVLARPGTNMYCFNGKTPDDHMILYTFKAPTWEELEKNIAITDL